MTTTAVVWALILCLFTVDEWFRRFRIVGRLCQTPITEKPSHRDGLQSFHSEALRTIGWGA
jgi:hypothetical protein